MKKNFLLISLLPVLVTVLAVWNDALAYAAEYTGTKEFRKYDEFGECDYKCMQEIRNVRDAKEAEEAMESKEINTSSEYKIEFKPKRD